MTVLPGRRRRTLAAPTDLFHGVGLHSGKAATLRFLPAPPQTGRVFRNPQTGQDISAHIKNLSDSERCTILGSGGWTLSTVEHVLSALAGLDVDDVVVEVAGEELPIGDGSSLPFVELLEASGMVEHGGTISPLQPSRPIMVAGEKGECVVCIPADEFRITVVLDYPAHKFIGTQTAELIINSASYRTDVSELTSNT